MSLATNGMPVGITKKNGRDRDRDDRNSEPGEKFSFLKMHLIHDHAEDGIVDGIPYFCDQCHDRNQSRRDADIREISGHVCIIK